MKFSSILEPQVVGNCLVQKMSLWAMGIPVRAVALPLAIIVSAISACLIDTSWFRFMKEFICLSLDPIRSK